jgi:cysteine synthase
LNPCSIIEAYLSLETSFSLLTEHLRRRADAFSWHSQPIRTSHGRIKRAKKNSTFSILHLALWLLTCLFFSIESLVDATHISNGGILPDITWAIGNTPLVDLSRISRRYGVEGCILGKCEYLSPGLSKKDRIAKQIILDALASGDLKPGQPVVELTSGNTGTGLAVMCAVLGLPFHAVMSKGNSEERARMMSALGAKVVLVDQAQGSIPGQVSGEDLNLVETSTQELVKKLSAFRADQFIRESNMKAHYVGTGPEIWNDSDGTVTAFCDFVGTGGSFGGVAAFLCPKGVRCYVVEPEKAAILAGKSVSDPNHRIQGGGYLKVAKDLPMLSSHEDAKIDGFIQVSDQEAIQAARDLARYEGIFCGFSGGANFAAAVKLLKTKEKGGTIAILLCDCGLKYLSTDLWE